MKIKTIKNNKVKKIITTSIATITFIQSVPIDSFANEKVNQETNIEVVNQSQTQEEVNTYETQGEEVKVEDEVTKKNQENNTDKKEETVENEVKNSINEDVTKIEESEKQDLDKKEKMNNKVESGEVVDIPDPNLREVLNEKLGNKPDSDITKEELKSIRRLEAEARNITDLNGLQYCTNIDYLNLGRNQISGISQLSELKKLDTLYLYENQISDISPLSGLTSLSTLELSKNQISDISPLSGLKNLWELGLDENQISDISPLSGLTDLYWLFLEECQISDISPLSGLTSLECLLLDNNQISDISPLSRLTELMELSLDKNQISDISPLSGLKNLGSLDLNDNQISDISQLAGLENLVALEIQNNQISDISPLSNLDNLEDLYAGNQTIYANEIKVDSESVEIKNEIKSVDGLTVQPTKISDGGEYNPDTNSIKWDNINSDCSRTYNFSKRVLRPSATYNVFSGKVIQPIKYSNDKPIILGADNISIKEGSTFDPKAGVTATDTEDGDITNRIDITGTVNTNEPGKYELTYTVKDNTGNIVTVKRVVTVNPKLELINEVPVIKASDKELTVGDKFDPLEGVTATDKEDGNIELTEENIIFNDVDTEKAGIYKVIYSVTDKKGASTTKTITVTVKNKDIKPTEDNDNTKPDNNVTSSNIVETNNNINYDNPKTGDVGVLGYAGLGLISITGLLLNKKKRK